MIFTYIILCIVFLAGCSTKTVQTNNSPKIKQGTLDVRQWDFKDGTIKLDGDWEFYWNELITPEQFVVGDILKEKNYIKVPGYWKGYPVAGKSVGSYGYATYRLHVKSVQHPAGVVSLRIPAIIAAEKVWVNGHLFWEKGKIGTARNEEMPQFKNHFISIPIQENSDLELVLHISNFFHKKGGGISDSFILGTNEQIRVLRERRLVKDLFLFGSLFIMGIYHIFLFILRKKDRSPLYLGIFCLLIASRTTINGEGLLLDMFPALSQVIPLKIEYTAFYMALPVFAAFLHSLFPEEVSKKYTHSVGVIGALSAAIVLLLPAHVYTHTLITYEVWAVGVCIWLVYALILSCIRKRKGAILILGGSTLLLAALINDSLFFMGILFTGSYFAAAFYLFILIQCFILSVRFSNAFFAVEKMSAQLTILDKMKDEFLANTSHELRTPLNGMIGIAESLLEGAAGNLNAQQAYNLSLIAWSGKRLSNLVNDILDFSKLKNKDIVLQRQPVDIRLLVDVVQTMSKSFIGNKPVQIKNEVPEELPVIVADENRIQQILYNLIGNAIKFTHEGEIIISAAEDQDFITITISDTGIGIPEDKIEEVFKSFEQVDGSTAREYGGTGLGLSITKQLIELHGGTIWVETKLGEGSKFIFTLPNHSEAGAMNVVTNKEDVSMKIELPVKIEREQYEYSTEYAASTVEEQEPAKILLVDDEPVNLQVLLNHLSLTHYTVKTAPSGIEALAVIEASPDFDLVILDVMMPKMSGYEVCKILRQKYSLSDLPVLMLTAKNRLEDIVEGLTAGANDYLPKPCNSHELKMRVKNLLSLKKAVEQAISNAQSLEYERKYGIAIKNLLDNAGQGFLSFGEDLKIHPQYSVQCTHIFGGEIAEHFFPTVAFPKDQEQNIFLNKLLHKIFQAEDAEMREVYLPLLPEVITVNERYIRMQYKLIYDASDRNEDLVMMIILTDITEHKELQNQIEKERNILRMVVKVVSQYIDFMESKTEYEDFCNEQLYRMMSEKLPVEHIVFEIFRCIHTFKGSFSQYEMVNITPKLHALEERISTLIQSEDRCTLTNLKQLLNGSEMLQWFYEDFQVLENILGESFMNQEKVYTIEQQKLLDIEQKIQILLSEQERAVLLPQIQRLRYRSFREVLLPYVQYASSLAVRMQKQIKGIEITGDTVWIDEEKYKGFIKSLVHVFRNSLDHGIESIEEREELGKEENGCIECSIKQKDGCIALIIQDDGRGMDVEALVKKAVAKGLYSMEEIEALSEEEVLQLIFKDDFSTAEVVTEISGRGMGLSAVWSELSKVKGQVSVSTKIGEGTRFEFLLPE